MSKKSYFLALCIAIISLVWIGSGLIGEDKKVSVTQAQQEEPRSSNDKLFQVRVADLVAQDYQQLLSITGLTQPFMDVRVRAEISGAVIATPIAEGVSVPKDTVIFELALEDRIAVQKQTKAALVQAQIEYKAASKLQKKGYGSEVRLATAQANLDAAQANLERATLDVNNARIKAPFDGVLERRMLNIGDFANRGDGVFRFVSLSPIKIVAFVTEQQKSIIAKGNIAKITLVNGAVIEGEIAYVASVADPVSRTFEIEVWADNQDNQIAAGLTANITIVGNTYKAYKISPSVLSLSDAGVVGVKLVDRENKIIFNPVEILTDTQDGIWVKGLDETIRLVTVGQEFVIDGQVVDPASKDIQREAE